MRLGASVCAARPAWVRGVKGQHHRRPVHVYSESPSSGVGVGVTMGHLPLAALAAVHLSGPEGVAAWVTVDGRGGVFEAHGECHVRDDVVGL